QLNGSQLVYEDLKQIHEDDIEEMDLKCHVGYYGAGFDWSYMADDEVPTNMALMAFLDSELEKLKQEKESSQLKIENFDNASKSLNKLIGSQINDKSRKGLGFVSYNAIPPPPTWLFSPPNLDLSNSGLEEFQQPEFEGYGPKTSKNVSEDTSNEVRESSEAPMVEKLVSDDKLEKKTVFPTVAKIEFGHPQKEDQGYVDSGCSRHMTGNMSYLSDFKEFDGGYVTFGGGAKGGKITGKGTLKTADESQVLLKVPRKNNMYSVDMKNIVPKESLTCLVAKATLDESMLWHRRLGDGPKWLFDIDVLTKSMNYVPVAGTNSNDSVGTEESVGTGHSSKETGSSQEYILMSLWKDGSLFDSSSKNASNDEPQPSSDAGKKDDEGVSQESGIDDQERPENSTQDVNTIGPSINTTSTNVNTGSLNINTVRSTVTTTLLKATHANFFGDETELDMSNITTTYLFPNTPNTRIHKDKENDKDFK
ncbi:hypothetical protein Tco_0810746, partial [Tanacetum coccineum]